MYIECVCIILTLHVLHYSRLLPLMSELPNGTIVYVPNSPTCQNSRHNKIKLRSVSVFMRQKIGHTALSASLASLVTLQIWQHGAKENYYNFASFHRAVDTKTSIIQMRPNILNFGLRMNLNRQ